MLSKVEHINIVAFVGYCVDPFLLIVMDFVSGGTLSDFVKKNDPAELPSMEMVMKILIGSATGLAYLHAAEPMPILHRDIKSENILLTEEFEPRIADMGEARVMTEDHAMTMVGTRGYTAPEVLRGEHYTTSADVFSFAIVMCELLALRAPYSDMIKDDQGEKILTWQQITALTQMEKGGLRPSLPDYIDVEMAQLVRDSWTSDPALRPSCRVIALRLAGIARSASQEQGNHIFDEAEAFALCRDVHDLLVNYKPAEWNKTRALTIIDQVRFCQCKSTRNGFLLTTHVPHLLTY